MSVAVIPNLINVRSGRVSSGPHSKSLVADLGREAAQCERHVLNIDNSVILVLSNLQAMEWPS